MNAGHILDALEMIDDQYILEARDRNSLTSVKKSQSMRRALILAAVITALLSLCGFAAYKFGWFDPWLQEPSASPTETVQSAIESQIHKDYTIDVRVRKIIIDENETARVAAMYTGSELAAERGWTDDYLAGHFVVVWAEYDVEYDHTKTFLDDGYTQQYFYLTRDVETGQWTIIDNTPPNTGAAAPDA